MGMLALQFIGAILYVALVGITIIIISSTKKIKLVRTEKNRGEEEDAIVDLSLCLLVRN